MQKWLFTLICFLSLTMHAHAQQSYTDRVNAYVQQYRPYAIEEQKASGVPAAVTLAQGILETQAGASELMTNANNHFGIKCKKEWRGETFTHTDDAPDECFRKYKNARDSYKDHSEYLKNSPRYSALFGLPPTDYAGWAKGLKTCGYATNPLYAQQLIKIIEDFQLQECTVACINGAPNDFAVAQQSSIQNPVNHQPPIETQSAVTLPDATQPHTTPVPGALVTVNGLKAVYGLKGESLLKYALKYNMQYKHMLQINNLPDAPLAQDMYLYLEKKNYRSVNHTHIVQKGETLVSISQAEGMKLQHLMVLNHIHAVYETPAPGSILQLQEEADGKPDMLVIPKPHPATPAHAPAYIQKTSIVQAGGKTPFIDPAAAPKPIAPVVVENKMEKPAAEKLATEKPVVEKPALMPLTNIVVSDATVTNANKPGEVSANAEQDTKTEVAKTEPIADNTEEPKRPDAPHDDLESLKANLDKVVYSEEKKVTPKAPPMASPGASVVNQTVQLNKLEAKFYVVKKGDTAFSIAKRNNITMRQLLNWNNLDFEDVRVGQRLRIKPE
ncbi:MAG: LysM peptidoglycan-binding domain-containing protein [Taibaiella sp.]|nr:LysM peptidoglycan-binding domain-containing protein [Taibaiella sp.]